MSSITKASRKNSSKLLGRAVHRNSAFSAEGVRERMFTLIFRNLVYPQIWEDPDIDLEAMQLTPESRIITIASGGCNALSYLTANPEHVTAIDLNAAHVALNRLKLAALRRFRTHAAFYRFFGEANSPLNLRAYDSQLRLALDPVTRTYWDSRDLFGRRRIAGFAHGFYRYGVLGRFIGAGHLFARIFGVDAGRILDATTLQEQQRIFDRHYAPLFDKRLVQWVLNRPALLYGLGIPPAQYYALAGGSHGASDVIKARLRRLACGAELSDNYFAWQAFGRSYPPHGTGRVPPYLEERHFEALKSRANRLEIRHGSLVERLKADTADSYDAYVLLDAQDWMSDPDLNELWSEITRTARPGARVIFRTAAERDLLPGRVAGGTLNRWTYEAEQSAGLSRRDRSAIYGAFHLYIAKA